MSFGVPGQNISGLAYADYRQALVPTVDAPRRPTTSDKKYALQTIWRTNKESESPASEGEEWILVKFDSSGDAIWVRFDGTGGASGLQTLTGDDAVQVIPDGAGDIDMLGNSTQGVSTSGAGSAMTITVADASAGQKGVVKVDNTTIVSVGGTISTSGAVATSYTADAGSAVPALGVLNVLGGTGCSTSGAGSTLTINADSAVPLSFSTDSGSAVPAANVITIAGGAGISTSGAGSTVTITADSSFSNWVEVTAATVALAVNTNYVMNRATTITATLPASAALGDSIRIVGKGAGGFTIAQNVGQTIFFGVAATATGIGGSISSNHRRDCVNLVCVTANNDWQIMDSIGNLTVV
jgi:hypothetical protein